MFKTILKIFSRQLLKHRVFSLINVVGLSVALTACLLINSFVSYELSYDRHYANAERLYQVASRIKTSDQRNESAISSALLAPMLKENVAGIEETARLGIFPAVLARENRMFKEEKLGFADNSLFTLFDLRWTLGNPDTALLDPGSIVLTQSLARKYFGEQSPLGETLLLNNSVALSVAGVIEDLPPNTHFDFSALLSLQQLETVYPVSGALNGWNLSSVATYLLLQPGMEGATVAARLPALMEQYSPTPPDVILTRELVVKKVTSVHLQPELDDAAGGSLATVVVFSITALSILLIAVINFVNLAISRYAVRSREVGVRKSAGAGKAELMLQFCGEAVLLSLGAMLIAVAASELMMPLLEVLTGNPTPFTYLSDPLSALSVLALAVLLGLIAGLYPAYYFASVQTVAALRGKMSSGKAALHLRNALVIFQFAAAICIIVVTLVIHLQVKHIGSMDMGYEPELVVELHAPPEWNQNYAGFWEPFKAQLLSNSGISSVTHSLTDFMNIGGLITQFRTGAAAEVRRIPVMSVGHDFFSTYQVRFLSGRDFSPALPTDELYPRDAANPGATLSGSFILNELAAREFGWTPQDAVGKGLYYGNSGVAGTVIGVVNNTLRSSRDLLRPLVYYTPRNGRYPFGGRISLKVSADNLQQTLEQIDNTWAAFFPNEPVSRFFLQDQLDAQYLTENRQATLFRYFALLAIVLSCMGLLGLAAFNAERRTKEIGVRKVMGSSVWRIVTLLTYDFSRLVLISNIIAWPLAYVAMSRWLENFAYRIDLTPMVFIGSGLIALCIAWVTVGGTAAKAASRKPVLALRYE